MTLEQKQRIEHEISNWRGYDLQESETVTESELAGMCSKMAALLQELMDAPTPKPFGYFKAEPFGWTDCAETDDGAIALYTAPPAPSVPPVRSTGQWESSRIADYNRGWNDCREATEKALNDLEKRK